MYQLHFECAVPLFTSLQFSSRCTIAALLLGLIFSVDSFEVYLRAVSVRNPANSASRKANTLTALGSKRLILWTLTTKAYTVLIKVNRNRNIHIDIINDILITLINLLLLWLRIN